MLQIEVYVLDTDTAQQVVAGTISLEGKKLVTDPAKPEYAATLEDLIAEPTMIGGVNLDPDQPELWIKNIYLMSGTYLRCTKPKVV